MDEDLFLRAAEISLALERAKVNRLELTDWGNLALASAAGVAGVGGIFGLTGAAIGAAVGGFLGLGLHLAANKN